MIILLDNYQNIGIKLEECINRPDNSIAKVGEWEGEWHVLDTFSLDYHFLAAAKRKM